MASKKRKRYSRRSTVRRGAWYTRMPRSAGLLIGALVLALIAVGAVHGANRHTVQDQVTPTPVTGSIVNAVTANTKSVPFDGAAGKLFGAAAKNHGSVAVYQVEGDGSITPDAVDFTPRLPNGAVVEVPERAAAATKATAGALATKLNTHASASSGQAVFAGLQHITNLNRGAPVIIVAGLFDTRDPVDFRSLAFDWDPQRLVSELERAGELPDLRGTTITYVVRPAAGDQPQPRQAQIKYAVGVWQTLLKAAGAVKVTFEFPDGTAPRVSRKSPTVLIPPTIETPVQPHETGAGTTCTLASATYFMADRAVLVDRVRTKAALRNCVARITPGSAIAVDGYASGNDPTNAFARSLSQARADLIAGLLADLGIPRSTISAVGHGNNRQPHPDNPTSPLNRVVVITSTVK